MGVSKRDPINRQPFTPLATDVFVRETHNVVRPVNDPIPEFGTPHDAISKSESWPHHRFCWQTEINEKGDCERWFVADPENQQLYNWQYTDAPDWPTLRQIFVIPREDFDPDKLDYAEPPNSVVDLTDFAVTAIEQTRTGEKQLDSLFVSVQVTREKITGNPKIGSVVDPQTNTLRQVLIEKVPAGTPGTLVNTSGQYSEVQPINTLWALKTTQFMAGLAGNGNNATQTWSDILNYSWPDVLLGFDFFSFPSSSGSIDSVTGRPVWKRQRYDGPCEATITEKWTLTPPTPPSFTPMLPREIEYRSPLLSISTPPCLHTAQWVWDTPGTNHPTLGFYVYSQYYEATELLDWPETYVASFTVRPASGGYLSRLVVVQRPDGVLFDNIIELDSPTQGTAVNSINVTWRRLNPNGTLTGYRLDVNTKPDFTGTFLTGFNNRNVGTATSFTITGLTPATQYFIRVRALISVGNATSNTQLAVAQPVTAFTITESATPVVEGGTVAFGTYTESDPLIVKTFTITNTGNVALTGLAVARSGAGADQWANSTPASSDLSANGTRTFTVTLDPNSAGSKSATVDVTFSNTIGLSFGVTGTAVATTPTLIVEAPTGSPRSSGYEFQILGATTRQITLRNNSWTGITITSIVLADGTYFSLGSLPTSVPAGGSAPFDLSYDGTPGPNYDSLDIASTALASPFTLNLVGNLPL